jgi:hypothetical protein
MAERERNPTIPTLHYRTLAFPPNQQHPSHATTHLRMLRFSNPQAVDVRHRKKPFTPLFFPSFLDVVSVEVS